MGYLSNALPYWLIAFRVGTNRTPPSRPCLLRLVVNPITVVDAVTPASGKDGISPSRKLSCQDSIRIPPYV